ncbi:sensor domain-containing diguanylate cyclase [Anaeromicrobium sediminis]|uniref:GGDEF domain-containing protein n=1 Tax=Anaeromicrobium sediminis TaxID=1478221 RepID=A0A267ME31_9FIRM|nr:sensor domain-containing diguanylate cyclase [Anaeromicrobium sediminis]PAB57834.1 hypothetical protein CCE28_17685 [Anaeromicrobium sediminis]
MNLKNFMIKKSYFIKYFFLLFIGISILYTFFFTILQLNTIKVKRNEIELNEKRIVELEKNLIGKEFDNVISDLLYISDSINEYDSMEKTYDHLAKEWLIFGNRKKIYDQIRFIDISGNEIIRINYYDNFANIVHKSELQNKKDRYYFKETMGLKKGQIYISKIDLNLENKKVQEPIKPMIRFSTPVFTKKGEVKGIVILNYYAKYLLQNFKSISATSDGELFLLNSNGYWISNNDKNKEWTFMYEDKAHINFKNEYSREWDHIRRNDKGMIYTNKGLFVFSNISAIDNLFFNDEYFIDKRIVLEEGNWKAVSHISKDSIKGDFAEANDLKILFALLGRHKLDFLLILIISTGLAVLMVKNKINKEEIKYFSEYDAMTNVLNRRAGLALLNEKIKKALNDKDKISICFIDINGLKEVNDVLGHDAGDELILTVVDGIKSCIRQTDFVMRLGGDEFLIVFNNSTTEQAEHIWERINNEYNKINDEENREYLVSVSHGIAEFEACESKYIDSIISMADERMYNEKREIKKDIKIIR